MKYFSLVILLGILSLGNLLAQVPVHAPTKVYPQSTSGWYETYKCYTQDKPLWVDSTQGYTSYNWSNGATTAATNIPWTQVAVFDTVSVIVGIPGGGSDTSHVVLRPAIDNGNYVFTCIPPADALCPGAVEFNLLSASDDSLVVWNNGNLNWQGGGGCRRMNYNLPHTGGVQFTRYQYEGCVYNGSSWFYTVLNANLAPTITDVNGTLTASHPDYNLLWTSKKFVWYDANQTQVATGVTFVPATNGAYTVELEVESLTGFLDVGGCYPFGQRTCTSTLSAPHLFVNNDAPQLMGQPFAYPNPAQTTFRIENAANIDELEVWNALGQRMRVVSGNNGKFDIQDLPVGRYWLRFEGESGPQILPLEKQ